MSSSISILFVDDDPQILRSTSEWLGSYGHSVLEAQDIRTATSILAENQIDLAFVDLRLGAENGMDVLLLIKENFPQIPVVLLSGHATIEEAMNAIRHGAADFLTKPLLDNKILEIIENRIQNKNCRSMKPSRMATANPARGSVRTLYSARETGFHITEVPGNFVPNTQQPKTFSRIGQIQSSTPGMFGRDTALSANSSYSFPIEGFIGTDSGMKAVFDIVERIADTRATVLLTGESGTGKSLLARSIHRLSRRRNASFVEVACGALPETLLESELFGHEIGAFTGAVSRKIGRFLQADGGTIFLDEIGTASLALQIKLLRVLQEFEFEAVGSTKTQRVDTRVILATNEDLLQAVSAGRFRQDLYYRINVINLELPALRQRPGDIPELAQFFLEKVNRDCGRSICGFDPETLRLLVQYSWPGNVRELQNVVERLVLLGSSPWILPTDLPEHIRSSKKEFVTFDDSISTHQGKVHSNAFRTPEPISQISEWQSTDLTSHSILKHSLSIPERQIILEALEAHHWSRTRTAEFLGINRATLYKKMKKLQLNPPPRSSEVF
ncbi:MAG: sigma-54-dependent Fis family transcriptional regulator [Planctomycetaceae bacterium]|nr:sigma-54-dependent Fis family transcriptional regulator [Planctomycetaceae bacterium]